jgi:hypothetical protein
MTGQISEDLFKVEIWGLFFNLDYTLVDLFGT